jgi:hypothetical protein
VILLDFLYDSLDLIGIQMVEPHHNQNEVLNDPHFIGVGHLLQRLQELLLIAELILERAYLPLELHRLGARQVDHLDGDFVIEFADQVLKGIVRGVVLVAGVRLIDRNLQDRVVKQEKSQEVILRNRVVPQKEDILNPLPIVHVVPVDSHILLEKV